MKSSSSYALLAILLGTLMIASLVPLILAKPIAPHPDAPKPPGLIWSTTLHLENGIYKSDAFFGAKTGSPTKMGWMSPPSPYIADYFIDGGSNYGTIDWTEVAAPQSFSWYVAMDRAGAAPTNATVSCEFENADVYFVPRDFSVVLENTDEGIHVNLRKENGYITGLPKYATLYVDNAVNIISIENLDPLVGDNGANLDLNVTVKNTGRETDNYVVSIVGSLDPVTGMLAPGENATVMVSTTLPLGTENIIIEALGDYASDVDYVTAQGGPPGVTVSISPDENIAENGATCTFVVTVTNTGLTKDNYTLENTDNTSWGLTLDDDWLDIDGGAYKTTILRVTIDNAATSCTRDNVTVTATATVHAGVSGSDSCVAHCKFGYAVDVVAQAPKWQEDYATEELDYIVMIWNTGANEDNFKLDISDTWGATIENAWVKMPAGENRMVGVHVTVPYGSAYCETDTITVTATSQGDNTITDSDSVTAHSKGTIDVDVSVDPDWQEAQPCETLYYKVTITNTGTVDECYDVTVSETLPWGAGLQIGSVKLSPTDDTFGRENSPTSIYGVPPEYHAYHFYTGMYKKMRQWSYLMFDLGGIPADATILDAMLNLNAEYGSSKGVYPYPAENLWVNAENVSNDAWDESTFNWSNRPSMGPTVLDKVMVRSWEEVGKWKWWSWNVGLYAISERSAGDNTVSIGLRPENDLQNASVWFYAKDISPGHLEWPPDNMDPRPYLEVTYPDISAAPIASAKICIPAGENVVIDLCVHIPMTAQHCDNDIITVEAVSKTKPSVSDSDSAIAHCYLAKVEVEIEPENQEAIPHVVDELINPQVRYDPVTFLVKVKNVGMLDDLYKLTVTDTLGWGLKIDPDELFVPAGDEEYAALSVTAPEDLPASIKDCITVTAEGKMASDKQVIIRPENSDNCWVHTAPIQAVEIEILPDNLQPQTGAPGSPLVWLVVIKNTGNVPSTFQLKVSEALSGVSQVSDHDNWEAKLDNTIIPLDVCEKWVTWLRVTVPLDAKTCEWDNITVTVDKILPEIHEDMTRYTVRAHVLEPGPRLPEGVIEIAVEAEVIAIDVWPVQYDFGVMDEHKSENTGEHYFKVRNVGNVDEDIYVQGTDAKSMPGEPVTTWTLSKISTGIDMYRLGLMLPSVEWLSTSQLKVWSSVAPGDEEPFGLKIETPTVITTPARMWARVRLTAVRAGEIPPP